MIRPLCMAAALVAALAVAGCGGGCSDDAPVLMTDRPDVRRPLESALGAQVDAHAVAPADAVAALARTSRPRIVIAHYVTPAPTAQQAWREHDQLCAAARDGLGSVCVITSTSSDPIDWATTKRAVAWWHGGSYCDLGDAAGDEQARVMARCVRLARDGVL